MISAPTDGQTYHYHNDPEPLVSLGRLKNKTGVHVLRRPDGTLVGHAGYDLRRPGEVWVDFVDAFVHGEIP